MNGCTVTYVLFTKKRKTDLNWNYCTTNAMEVGRISIKYTIMQEGWMYLWVAISNITRLFISYSNFMIIELMTRVISLM